MLKKITLDQILNKLSNKKIFLRTDFNVPMKDGQIVDDFRIQSSLSSMNKILQNKPKSLIIGSHLGRPNGQYVDQYSLKPVYEYLKKNFDSSIQFIEYPLDDNKVKELQNKEGIFLLENLRFNPEEEGKVKKADGTKEKVNKDDIQNFRNKLTQMSDIYINDAFGTMHRAHSSIVGVDVDLKIAGDLVQKELQNFGQILEHPENLGILLGGAKVADKIPVIKNLLEKSQNIMIGGAMAFTFLKVKNDIDIGDSLYEEKSRQKVEDILNIAEKKNAQIHLPLDFVAGQDLKDENSQTKVYQCGDQIEKGWKGFDIGPQTVQEYTKFIKECDQLVWNGPMGVFENQLYSQGSFNLAKQIASRTQANKLISIIGGGDTANLVETIGLKDQFTHVSTGGGASLELMAGEELPGVQILSSI